MDKRKNEHPDIVNQIMAFESGEMQEDEAIEFFQSLIDTGIAWQLQGTYGRSANALIAAGLCTPQNCEHK